MIEGIVSNNGYGVINSRIESKSSGIILLVAKKSNSVEACFHHVGIHSVS